MKTLAVVCADIHLAHKKPSARSSEPDWYTAQGRMLDQLRSIAEQEQAPILCAGDVFHRFNPPPALINFAIERLPPMYAVPGQHDQQHHRKSLEPTAFLTLVKTGVIKPINELVSLDRLVVHGWGWGESVQPVERNQWDEHSLHLALIHQYCATAATAHPGASKASRPSAMRAMLRGYDFAVFGDNHIPFETKVMDCQVYNCGCFLRRSKNERVNHTSVGVIKEDGTIERRELDCSQDLWADDELDDTPSLDFSGFVTELDSISRESLDYTHALRRAAENEAQRVRTVLLQTLENVDDAS